MENIQFEHFRQYLQNELVLRCKKNPRYSLRSFAKSLNIDASPLSQILRSKRKITRKTFDKLSQNLSLNSIEIESFITPTTSILNRSLVFDEITHDMFEILSDWYHFAILELINIESFTTDKKWISKVLNITVSEVNISIERLIRVKLLKINEHGGWVDLSCGLTNFGDPKITKKALKDYQIRLHEKSIEAINTIPIEKRDHSATTFAIDTDKIEDAKKLIYKFRREMGQLLTGKNENEVYQLIVGLFPLSDSTNGDLK